MKNILAHFKILTHYKIFQIIKHNNCTFDYKTLVTVARSKMFDQTFKIINNNILLNEKIIPPCLPLTTGTEIKFRLTKI